MHIKIINFFINIFKIFYRPFIIPFRLKSREYVYNYFIKNNITYLFPYDLKIKYLTYNKDNKVFLRYIKTNKIMFYFYFWVFWIWYDDETYDNINLFKLYELSYKYPFLNKYLENDLKKIKVLTDNPTFLNLYNDIEPYKYLKLFFISLFYSGNNYYNFKMYNKRKSKLHKSLVLKNDVYIYKI